MIVRVNRRGLLSWSRLGEVEWGDRVGGVGEASRASQVMMG